MDFENNNDQAAVIVLQSHTPMFALMVVFKWVLNSFEQLFPLYNLLPCIILIAPKKKKKMNHVIKYQFEKRKL